MTDYKTQNAIEDNIVEFLKVKKYEEQIDALSGSSFLLHYNDVFDFQIENPDKKLCDYLNERPGEFIDAVEIAVKRIYQERHGVERSVSLDLDIHVDSSPLEINVNKAIKNKFVGKLVSLQASVNGASDIKNRLVLGVWICPEGHETRGIEEPSKCGNENCKHKDLEMDSSLSKIESYRTLYLKEIDFTGHHTDALVAEAVGELSDLANIGDMVKTIGIIYSKPISKKFRRTSKELLNIFRLVNISKINKIDYQSTPEEKKLYNEFPKQPGFYSKIINSMAPSISKNELVKEGYLLAYIGAPRWDGLSRNWINVLSVGDPGTAKSKIAQWANKTLPNVEIVSAKASSAKGLFAGQKEQIDGNKVLELGPMCYLSGRGLLNIDEFVRMPEEYDMFYTPMEFGYFPSATVGGHANIATETPIYATGNPRRSNYWDEEKSILENLEVLDPALLSRFDLTIITKDEQSETRDREIVRVSLNMEEKRDRQEVYNEADLVKYLSYAKTFNPTLPNNIREIIGDMFIDIRKQARSKLLRNQDITPRVIGSLTRLTLAIARLHLHLEATEEDVSLAKKLMERVYNQRGLEMSNANTYIDRIGQKIHDVLESSLVGLTDQEIYDDLFVKFASESVSLRNDIGGLPNRANNKRWRHIMENVEKSFLIEVESQHPKKTRYKREQKTI